jgi:hypothetical protein
VRTPTIAAIIVSLALPAFAQDTAGGNKHHAARSKKTEAPKVQANDKDYKAALDRLPQPKYDPWATARPTSDKPR